MTAFILGFVGAVSALGLFSAGVCCGWQLHAPPRARAVPTELQRPREEEEAFRRLQTYSAADAYGLTRSAPAAKEEPTRARF